jgi:hypothetical protein
VTAEKALVLSLRERLHLVPGRLVHFDGNDAGKFAKRLQGFQESETTTFSREVMSDARLLPQIDIQGSRFEITFQTDEDESRVAEVAAVYQAWRDGLDVVPLADGGWAPLPIDWLERYGSKVADILAARRSDGEVPHYAAAPLASLCLELGKPTPPSFENLKPLFENFEGLPEAPLPLDLPATLRPYQRTGVNWLHFLSNAGLGAVLADDMGLGKTQDLGTIRSTDSSAISFPAFFHAAAPKRLIMEAPPAAMSIQSSVFINSSKSLSNFSVSFSRCRLSNSTGDIIDGPDERL